MDVKCGTSTRHRDLLVENTHEVTAKQVADEALDTLEIDIYRLSDSGEACKWFNCSQCLLMQIILMMVNASDYILSADYSNMSITKFTVDV
jgi:hypothetical protein